MIQNPSVRFIEISVLFIITLCYWAQYGFVGDMASLQQVNYIHLITTPLDQNIKFNIFWSFFYSTALIIPFLVAWLIIIKSKFDLLLFYRIFFTCLLVLSIHYIIYFLFPTRINLWEDPEFISFWQQDHTSWLAKNTEFVVSITSPWNTFPSYHIGSGWIVLRYCFERFKLLSYIYTLWFIGMCIGAFTLKFHLILDGIIGIIISELIYQLFKTNKMQTYLLHYINKYSRKILIPIYCVLALFLTSLVFYQLLHAKPKFIPGYITSSRPF